MNALKDSRSAQLPVYQPYLSVTMKKVKIKVLTMMSNPVPKVCHNKFHLLTYSVCDTKATPSKAPD